jgi:hypothetical protein
MIIVFIGLEGNTLRYNILLMLILLTGIFYYVSHPFSKINWKNKGQVISIIQKLLFLSFPVLALQGTNVRIEFKLLYVSFIWIFILSRYLFTIKNRAIYKTILYAVIILVLSINVREYFYTHADLRGTIFNSNSKIENNVQFRSITLRQRQVAYFQQVDSILQINHFDPQKDRILAFDYDYATLLYLNAPNYGGLMHHIMNMENYKSIFYSRENAPEYILVPQDNKRRLARLAKKFDWSQDYTEYKLGSPDVHTRYFVGPRSLFVKKEKP